jgi:predicted nucleotidyltransferase
VIELSKVEIDDLRDLDGLCKRMNADLVIVGAIAYQLHFSDDELKTGDIDFAIALDLADFKKLQAELSAVGWAQESKREERWRSKHGTLLDLIPAGKTLRESKQFTWPKSEFTMSLEGFDHAFSEAKPVTLADDLVLRVIPPVVLMLLKIIAFMDDPQRRRKDLFHIRALLSRYQADSDRVFTKAITDAGIEYDLASAFLLGLDLRELCTEEEMELVRSFIARVGDEDKSPWWAFVNASHRSGEREAEAARAQLKAFSEALSTG